MATKFIGHYKLDKSENFDAFMAALGVNAALRQIGKLSSPELTMEQVDGEHYKIKQWTMVKSHTWDFTFGQEFEGSSADGRKVKTTVTMEGENLVITENPADGSDLVVTYSWELMPDAGICSVQKAKDVVSKRIYKRV